MREKCRVASDNQGTIFKVIGEMIETELNSLGDISHMAYWYCTGEYQRPHSNMHMVALQ